VFRRQDPGNIPTGAFLVDFNVLKDNEVLIVKNNY
jgi:hypothetical protein